MSDASCMFGCLGPRRFVGDVVAKPLRERRQRSGDGGRQGRSGLERNPLDGIDNAAGRQRAKGARKLDGVREPHAVGREAEPRRG